MVNVVQENVCVASPLLLQVSRRTSKENELCAEEEEEEIDEFELNFLFVLSFTFDSSISSNVGFFRPFFGPVCKILSKRF